MPPQSLPTSQVAWQLSSPIKPLEAHLQLNQTAPIPPLKPDQTLIRVLSTSLNPVDYKILEIGFLIRFLVRFPIIPAQDFVGRVWSTRLSDDQGIKAGDLVFGTSFGSQTYGALGQFMIVPGRQNMAHVPNLRETGGVELDDFSTIGVAGLTAYQSLIPLLGKRPGDGRGKCVFINGGSGGTGTFGIQIAKKILGCDDVVVSCSAANAELCRSLGADEIIDYRSQNIIDALKSWVQKKGRKFDLLIDNVGNDTDLYWQSHHYLNEASQFTLIAGGPNFQTLTKVATIHLWPEILGGGKRKFVYFLVKADGEEYLELGNWVQEGKISTIIDSTFAFEDAPKAFEKLRTGRARGKIVVRVNEEGR